MGRDLPGEGSVSECIENVESPAMAVRRRHVPQATSTPVVGFKGDSYMTYENPSFNAHSPILEPETLDTTRHIGRPWDKEVKLFDEVGFQHFEYLRDLGYGTRPTEFQSSEFDKSLTDFAATHGPEMPFPDDEYEMEMGTGHFTTDGGQRTTSFGGGDKLLMPTSRPRHGVGVTILNRGPRVLKKEASKLGSCC